MNNDSPLVFDHDCPAFLRPSPNPPQVKEWPEVVLRRELQDDLLKCTDPKLRAEIEATIQGLDRSIEKKTKALEGYVPRREEVGKCS